MRSLLVFLAVVGLAACGSVRTGGQEGGAAPERRAKVSASVADAPQKPAADVAAGQAAAASAPNPPAPTPRPQRTEPETLDLASLERNTSDQVRNRLGSPQGMRATGPGQVWTYRRGSCSLEVYLYPEVGKNRTVVLGSKLFPETLNERERGACLKAMKPPRRTSS